MISPKNQDNQMQTTPVLVKASTHQSKSLHVHISESWQNFNSTRSPQLIYKKKQVNVPVEMEIVRVPAKGPQCCLMGFAQSYQEEYPQALCPYLTREEFNSFITQLNQITIETYPGQCTLGTVYLCTLLTCFISLVNPKVCFEEGFRQIDLFVGEQNISWEPKKIQVRLERNMKSGSYLVFVLPKPNPEFNATLIEELEFSPQTTPCKKDFSTYLELKEITKSRVPEKEDLSVEKQQINFQN